MKAIHFIILIATQFSFAQVQLNVVTSDSKVQWTGTKVVGYHQGLVKIKSGFVQLKGQKLTGGEFVIDMSSLTCTDIPEDDLIPKQKLENHLKAKDFFDVVKFPTATFKITEVRIHPDNAAKYLVLGDLTIKGITKRWKVEVEPSTQTDKLFIAQAEIRFDRQQFGVAYKGLKDELVHDLVKLNVILKAK
jgi:YceI-like domain